MSLDNVDHIEFMLKMNQVDHEMISSFLAGKIADLQAIYLYGSAVGEHYSESSDIDIAVKARTGLDNLKRWKLQEELAAMVGREVDLVETHLQDFRDFAAIALKSVNGK